MRKADLRKALRCFENIGGLMAVTSADGLSLGHPDLIGV